VDAWNAKRRAFSKRRTKERRRLKLKSTTKLPQRVSREYAFSPLAFRAAMREGRD